MPEIKQFLCDNLKLKQIIKMTKETDAIYFEKRNIPEHYNPIGHYDYFSWNEKFTADVKNKYELLHTNLLYTDEKQDFSLAVQVFTEINEIFNNINE